MLQADSGLFQLQNRKGRARKVRTQTLQSNRAKCARPRVTNTPRETQAMYKKQTITKDQGRAMVAALVD
ncbi:MAG: hypothetical protein AUK51_02150 [Comamonadaceae bacterium CG2_30_59_20]|nr:MAG: hypothetical protein AUK51_02150 [Comamonadaceae bacterium CG2_30_59_20]